MSILGYLSVLLWGGFSCCALHTYIDQYYQHQHRISAHPTDSNCAKDLSIVGLHHLAIYTSQIAPVFFSDTPPPRTLQASSPDRHRCMYVCVSLSLSRSVVLDLLSLRTDRCTCHVCLLPLLSPMEQATRFERVDLKSTRAGWYKMARSISSR